MATHLSPSSRRRTWHWSDWTPSAMNKKLPNASSLLYYSHVNTQHSFGRAIPPHSSYRLPPPHSHSEYSPRLDEIENPRLQCLKTHTMAYNLTAQWIKGAKNYAPDALSCNPIDDPKPQELLLNETCTTLQNCLLQKSEL